MEEIPLEINLNIKGEIRWNTLRHLTQRDYRTQLKKVDVASARHHASQLARHLAQLVTRAVSTRTNLTKIIYI